LKTKTQLQSLEGMKERSRLMSPFPRLTAIAAAPDKQAGIEEGVQLPSVHPSVFYVARATTTTTTTKLVINSEKTSQSHFNDVI
jgi:hypothetical protein